MRILIHAGVLSMCPVLVGAQARDAATVLSEMRKALGGDAALEAVKSFSVSGDVRLTLQGRSRVVSQDIYAVLPDRFLRLRRDTPTGPIPIDIVYHDGFNGSELIRRTDATGLQFPPDPYPDKTPAAVAQRRLAATISQKQAFARLALVLLGTSLSSYPLQFSYVGSEPVDGRTYDVIEAKGPDGFTMRLHVDATTHLPARVIWEGERGFIVSTSSTVVTRGNDVVSQSPPSAPVAAGPPQGGTPVEFRWVLSDFKVEDGLTWPSQLKETGADLTEEVRFRRFRLNPKIDPRKFDVPK